MKPQFLAKTAQKHPGSEASQDCFEELLDNPKIFHIYSKFTILDLRWSSKPHFFAKPAQKHPSREAIRDCFEEMLDIPQKVVREPNSSVLIKVTKTFRLMHQ